jgi:hypothetical protein
MREERALSDPTPTKDSTRKRLSKDERRKLLKQLERASSRSESAEAVLARVEQAIEEGKLEQAGKFLLHLGANAPGLVGLGLVQEKLQRALRLAKQKEKVRAAEEILNRYIQQRKKKLAALALQTLTDIEPLHHLLPDYRVWVAELDQEVAMQQRLELIVKAGREAIIGDDLSAAQGRLTDLRKLNGEGPMTQTFSAEVDFLRRGREESSDIEKSKQRLEDFLARGQMKEAEAELTRLTETNLPKITLDFLRKRLDDMQSDRDVRSRVLMLERDFRQCLQRGDWDEAREIARQAGQQTGNSETTTDLFNEVDQREGEMRHRQSMTQGLSMLQKFIAEGKKSEAELALTVLQRLDLEPGRFRDLERQVQNL